MGLYVFSNEHTNIAFFATLHNNAAHYHSKSLNIHLMEKLSSGADEKRIIISIFASVWHKTDWIWTFSFFREWVRKGPPC